MIVHFADSFSYLAMLNQRDECHERAVRITRASVRHIVTTSWICTEVGDALASSKDRSKFPRFVRRIAEAPSVEIVAFSESLFQRGLKLYEERADKLWSLTDCVSFVVMQESGIREALTGDHHFEQAGFIAALK